ncbi:MAG: hypothetical protein WB561_00500 [Terracidiphilus sp.]
MGTHRIITILRVRGSYLLQTLIYDDFNRVLAPVWVDDDLRIYLFHSVEYLAAISP